ncbi:MAG: sugar ABC transporter ATP-binding protein [Clostridiales bacterium]|nr:sugar ABC transporter ATP-binding protein [Clostridiales bacterium]
MKSDMILKLENIKKSFGGVHALKGIDFQLRKGEVHALLGENGAGKSTLIKILTGVYQPDSGTVTLNVDQVSIVNTIDARRRGIAAIYQELSLIEALSVAENIFLGNEASTTKLGFTQRKKLIEKSDAFLEKFGIPISSSAKVSSLGLGQKRVIEIVKALAIDAEILLLDEPTTGMSKTEIDILFEIIQSLKEKNVTMIYISHYLDEVYRCCDRATVLRDGSNVDTFSMETAAISELVRAMIGHSVSLERYRLSKPRKEAPVILECREYKTTQMKHPLSFSLYQGEILGITGIVGAGKSELAASLFGVFPKTHGEMFVKNQVVHLKNPHDTKAFQMAYIPEDRKTQGLFLEDSVEDNIVLPHIQSIENKLKLLDNKKKFSLAQQVGSRMRLQPMDVKMKAGNLSGGNQQKVVLGKWFTTEPNIVILDEPTRGIDVGAKEEIYRLINQMAEEGKSILIVSSEMEELMNICDRIMVLCKGKLVGETAAENVTVENLMMLALGVERDE